MTKKIIVFLFFILLKISCNKRFLEPQNPFEEYRVYSAVLNSLYIGEETKLIVMQDSTDIFPLYDTRDSTLNKMKNLIKKHFKGIHPSTIDDFVKKNKKRHKIEKKLFIRTKYTLISDKEIAEIFKDTQGWDRFYKLYPHSQGILTFSRVGFNPNMNQAVLYAGNQAHFFCGKGILIFLIKNKKGEWIIKNTVLLWIS